MELMKATKIKNCFTDRRLIMGIKCGGITQGGRRCTEYYSETLANCPTCGAVNDIKFINEEKERRRTKQTYAPVNNQTHMMFLRRRYGIPADHPSFKSIIEKWSPEKCIEGLRKFRLGKIALRNINIEKIDSKHALKNTV